MENNLFHIQFEDEEQNQEFISCLEILKNECHLSSTTLNHLDNLIWITKGLRGFTLHPFSNINDGLMVKSDEHTLTFISLDNGIIDIVNI